MHSDGRSQAVANRPSGALWGFRKGAREEEFRRLMVDPSERPRQTTGLLRLKPSCGWTIAWLTPPAGSRAPLCQSLIQDVQTLACAASKP